MITAICSNVQGRSTPRTADTSALQQALLESIRLAKRIEVSCMCMEFYSSGFILPQVKPLLTVSLLSTILYQ